MASLSDGRHAVVIIFMLGDPWASPFCLWSNLTVRGGCPLVSCKKLSFQRVNKRLISLPIFHISSEFFWISHVHSRDLQGDRNNRRYTHTWRFIMRGWEILWLASASSGTRKNGDVAQSENQGSGWGQSQSGSKGPRIRSQWCISPAVWRLMSKGRRRGASETVTWFFFHTLALSRPSIG